MAESAAISAADHAPTSLPRETGRAFWPFLWQKTGRNLQAVCRACWRPAIAALIAKPAKR